MDKDIKAPKNPSGNFIIQIIEDKKRIIEALKNGKKMSSIKGIKIVSPL